jgi:hypothetical protein
MITAPPDTVKLTECGRSKARVRRQNLVHGHDIQLAIRHETYAGSQLSIIYSYISIFVPRSRRRPGTVIWQ